MKLTYEQAMQKLFVKNDILDLILERNNATWRCLSEGEIGDCIPEKFLNKIAKTIYKNFKKTYIRLPLLTFKQKRRLVADFKKSNKNRLDEFKKLQQEKPVSENKQHEEAPLITNASASTTEILDSDVLQLGQRLHELRNANPEMIDSLLSKLEQNLCVIDEVQLAQNKEQT